MAGRAIRLQCKSDPEVKKEGGSLGGGAAESKEGTAGCGQSQSQGQLPEELQGLQDSWDRVCFGFAQSLVRTAKKYGLSPDLPWTSGVSSQSHWLVMLPVFEVYKADCVVATLSKI